MKKESKIIKLRTAAKLKVAEIETKIAFARREAAGKRAHIMRDRAAELDGLEAGCTKRFDVIAKYRAKLAGVAEQLEAVIAQHKFVIQQTKAECERQCAAVEDNPETASEQQCQDKVYCDGSEHSARIVARRLINKMPHIPLDSSINVSIIRHDNGDFLVTASEIVKSMEAYALASFSKVNHNEQSEFDFIKKAHEAVESNKDKDNSHVAEPLARALDAVFGGNPLDDIPTARKEDCDE